MMNSERPIDFPNFKKRLIGAFYEGRPPARCDEFVHSGITCQFRYDCGSHPNTPKCLSLFRRKYFLSTNLVNQIVSAHVSQMRSLSCHS